LSPKPPETEGSCADSAQRANAGAQPPEPRSQEFVELQKAIEGLKNDKSKWIASVVIPGGSLLLAIMALGAGTLMQYETSSSQHQTAVCSTEFAAKHKAYTELLNSLDQSSLAMFEYSNEKFLDYADQLRSGLNAIDPFLDPGQRARFKQLLGKFTDAVGEANEKASKGNHPNVDVTGKGAYLDKVEPINDQLHSELHDALFKNVNR
jgi:hypothetical protein